MSISWDKRNRQWKARLSYRGADLWLGNFADREGAEMAVASFWDEERRAGNKLCWLLGWRFGGEPMEYLGSAVAAIRQYSREAGGRSLFGYVVDWVKRGDAEVDREYAAKVYRDMAMWRGGYLYAYCFTGDKWEVAKRLRGAPDYADFHKDIERLTKDAESHIIGVKEVCG